MVFGSNSPKTSRPPFPSASTTSTSTLPIRKPCRPGTRPTSARCPVTRPKWDAGDIPGANLTYTQADTVAPTQGRALDHIGFEVKILEAFCKKLTDAGIKLDTPVSPDAATQALPGLSDRPLGHPHRINGRASSTTAYKLKTCPVPCSCPINLWRSSTRVTARPIRSTAIPSPNCCCCNRGYARGICAHAAHCGSRRRPLSDQIRPRRHHRSRLVTGTQSPPCSGRRHLHHRQATPPQRPRTTGLRPRVPTICAAPKNMNMTGKFVRESISDYSELALPNDANSLGNLLGGKIMHLVDLAGRHRRHAPLPATPSSPRPSIRCSSFILSRSANSCASGQREPRFPDLNGSRREGLGGRSADRHGSACLVRLS